MATTVRNLRISEAELAGLHEAWEELEDPRLENQLNKICDDPPRWELDLTLRSGYDEPEGGNVEQTFGSPVAVHVGGSWTTSRPLRDPGSRQLKPPLPAVLMASL